MQNPAPGTDQAFDAAALAARVMETPEEVFAEVRQAAQTGQVVAQLALAQMHMEGKGTVRDPQAAVLWYSVAASNGHAQAMNMLGRCHELGEGTAANEELAASWYRRAADAGLDWGLYNYANLLATGRGVAKDAGKALALYTRAANAGHAKSMNLVARHLEEGLETGRDPQAALACYKRAAESGDFRGQANYASILLQAGRIDEAVDWLERALPHGSPAFIAHIIPELAASPHAPVRELVARFAND